MKKTNYLCIDDMPDDVQVAATGLSSAILGLEIKVQAPKVFKTQLVELVRLRKNNKLDGVILDLRLDESSARGQGVDYKAQNLAGVLRTQMAEGKLRDFPIVLWSISQKFARSYNKDLASHDLFDLIIHKEELHARENTIAVADKLVSLSRGFESVAKQPRGKAFWKNLLEPPSKAVLDTRIGQKLDTSVKKSATHLIARYVLKSIVEMPGPLVDQSLVCARLGIDEASSDRPKLFQKLNQLAIYKGPFSEAWPRWWWSAIEKWWRQLNADLPPILSLTAVERVEQLRKSGYKKLRAAQPIGAGYSTRYTTICQHLRRPLDPIDGFMLSAAGFEPWHDRLYVSREVALRSGFHRFNQQLDSLESDRLKSMRKAPTTKTHGK